MALDEIIKSIVFNESINDLLTDALSGRALRAHPYKKLVEFQRKTYAACGTSLEDEGFQAGEPWNGDTENAKILFLSSNPAFTFNEKFPRYHAATKTIAMPGGKEMPLPAVEGFFRGRFQNAPANGTALRVELMDKAGKVTDTKAVSYWGCVRNNVERLLPASAVNAMKNAGPPGSCAKKLMSYAVCMEIVPFKSNDEEGVADALDTCWDEFTRHILPRAAAPVFVLVGNSVRETFLKKALDGKERANAEKILGKKEIYLYKDSGGTTRSVVNAEFLSGKIRRFDTYFPQKTLGTLSKIIH